MDNYVIIQFIEKYELNNEDQILLDGFAEESGFLIDHNLLMKHTILGSINYGCNGQFSSCKKDPSIDCFNKCWNNIRNNIDERIF